MAEHPFCTANFDGPKEAPEPDPAQTARRQAYLLWEALFVRANEVCDTGFKGEIVFKVSKRGKSLPVRVTMQQSDDATAASELYVIMQELAERYLTKSFQRRFEFMVERCACGSPCIRCGTFIMEHFVCAL